MPNKDDRRDEDPTKSKYGFWIVIIGFAVVVAVFVFAARKWSDVKDVTSAVGSVTGVVGTLAGAYFGVSAGSAGKAKAEAERQQAQEKVERLSALLPPDQAARALRIE